MYDSDLVIGDMTNVATQVVMADAGEESKTDSLRSPVVGCRPNPQSESDCTEICPERCNGRDDDCDGKVDETAATLCPLAAHADAICRDGKCLIARCQHHYRDCDDSPDNGCEVTDDDPEQCGWCGHACVIEHASAFCEAGACQRASCDDGWGDCDDDGGSCETRLDTPEHCGECGQRCSGACVEGQCVTLACADQAPGHEDCDHDGKSCETDLTRDSAHCGSCGNACHSDVEAAHAELRCEAGRCRAACQSGYGDCDGNYRNGCEQALSTLDHCGSCKQQCAAPHSLPDCATSAGSAECRFERCESGWADCDQRSDNGCERDARALSLGGSGPCLPDGSCTRVSSGSYDYYFCTARYGWATARMHCRLQLRGDLAHISDPDTAAFIRSHITTPVWLAASDAQHEGLWVWMNDGVPFWQVVGGIGRALGTTYAPLWQSSQPNGTGNCGAFSGGGLDDVDCSIAEAFVCEVTPDECPDDPLKVSPGQCGCNMVDTDANRDGLAECVTPS